MNMVTQIIYLGRMEVGDWYYAVYLKKKKNLNRVCSSLSFLMYLLLSSAMNMVLKILYFGRMEGGDWYYAVFKINLFNGLSSILDLSILT